jgi:hypothetical protein
VLDRLELHLIVLAGMPCIGLSNNTSWRFVDADYVFPDPTNPFSPAYPESISYTNVMMPQTGDFIGIKIGDLILSADPSMIVGPGNGGGSTSAPSVGERGEKIYFSLDDYSVETGNEYRVEFKAKDFQNLVAYQYTLGFDADVLQFKSVEMGALPELTPQHFGTGKANEGLITSLWYSSNATTMQDDEVLFTLVFDAIGNAASLSHLLSIQADPVTSMAFDESMLESEIGLTFTSLTGTAEPQNGHMALYQNRPNPFTSETIIPFYLPQATHATLTISDVSGKVVKVLEGDFTAGNHDFKVSRKDVSSTGVFFYRLSTAEGNTAVKKMILLD